MAVTPGQVTILPSRHYRYWLLAEPLLSALNAAARSILSGNILAQSPLATPTSPEVKSKEPTMTGHSASRQHTGLLALPPTGRTNYHLRAFALAVPLCSEHSSLGRGHDSLALLRPLSKWLSRRGLLLRETTPSSPPSLPPPPAFFYLFLPPLHVP